MNAIRRIVDDRTFLLGLDWFYRKFMKRHERGELIAAARVVTDTLGVAPADVPIEGYYSEDKTLREYFRRMRALQSIDASAAARVEALPEFRRLLAVASSPIYGPTIDHGKLLPVGRDALAQALADTAPDWTLETLVRRAQQVARDRDEYSLVGLAARTGEAVLLAAFAESTILYREMLYGGINVQPTYLYVWEVSAEIEQAARRFAAEFTALLDESLPPIDPEFAEVYWRAAEDNEVKMRCACIGEIPERADRFYHWAIRPSRHDDRDLDIDEFWAPELWTTRRYRKERLDPSRHAEDVAAGRWIPPKDGKLLPEDPLPPREG